MSQEYIFYPAFKTAEGKYKPLLFEEEGEPASVFWRSQSFIDGDYFTETFQMVSEEDFDESCREYFADRYEGLTENPPTFVYDIDINTLVAGSGDDGVVSGYAPLEQIREYYSSDEQQDYIHYCMDIIPPELYAELPEKKREEYGRFAAVDYFSNSFVCSHLLRIIYDIYVPYDWEGEKCFLMVFSF